MWNKWDSFILLFTCKLAQPLWKMVWQFLKNLKIIPIMWPSISTAKYLCKRKESICPHINLYINIHKRFVIAKNCKEPKCLWTVEWMNKLLVLPFNSLPYCPSRKTLSIMSFPFSYTSPARNMIIFILIFFDLTGKAWGLASFLISLIISHFGPMLTHIIHSFLIL